MRRFENNIRDRFLTNLVIGGFIVALFLIYKLLKSLI